MYPFSTLLCMKMIARSEIGLAWVEMLNLCKNEILDREITFYRINVTLFGKFKEDILKQHLTFYFIPPWASVDFNHCSRRHLLSSQTSVVKIIPSLSAMCLCLEIQNKWCIKYQSWVMMVGCDSRKDSRAQENGNVLFLISFSWVGGS